MVSLLLNTLVAALLAISALPSSQAMTITSSSSSGSSSGASYVNGVLVDGHCQASKNGYSSGCADPTFGAVPDAITTVSPGNFMPMGFPPLPNMDNFGNFPPFNQNPFSNFMNGSPLNPQFPTFNNFNPFGNFNNFLGFPGFPNF